MITLSRSGKIKMRLYENDLHKIHSNFNGELFLKNNLTSPKNLESSLLIYVLTYTIYMQAVLWNYVYYSTDNSGINFSAVYCSHLRLLSVTTIKSAIFCYQLISNIYNDITARKNNRPVGSDAVYFCIYSPSFGGETCLHLQGKSVVDSPEYEHESVIS